MWVHRSGEFFHGNPNLLYEYQTGRAHEFPLDFYRDYKGVLVTNSLSQYYLVEKKLDGLRNANCWANARRDFADAVKAMEKKDTNAVRRSVAYQALSRIGQIYKLDEALKDLPAEKRLQERQANIRPLVEEYFT